MASVKKLDLIQAGVILSLFTVLAFIVQSGSSLSYIWWIGAAFAINFVVIVWLRVRIRTTGQTRSFDEPVSEKTGSRLLNGAVGAWLLLVILMNAGMLFLGLRSTPSVGISVGALFLAGVLVGWRLLPRFSNNAILAYGASLTGSWILILIVLGATGILDLFT